MVWWYRSELESLRKQKEKGEEKGDEREGGRGGQEIERGKLKDSRKICFFFLFLVLFLPEPAPSLYTCLRMQIVYVFLVKDKQLMISLE